MRLEQSWLSKVQPLLHPGVHPKLLSKLRIFSKTLLKNGEKAGDQVYVDEIDQFYKYFLFLQVHLLLS